MNTNNNLVLSLPKEIIHHILDYIGLIQYRNGEYINIIHRHDARYRMLDSIPRMRLYNYGNSDTFSLFIAFSKKNLLQMATIHISEYRFCYNFINKGTYHNPIYNVSYTFPSVYNETSQSY
jgi:hypothetical protein